MESSKPYGGIEAGGTKFLCMVGHGPGDILDEVRIETTTPAATLDRAVRFFRPHCKVGHVETIGIGCFGPIDLEHESPTYGFITSTPKPGWQNTDLVGLLMADLGVSIAFDTDVNAAALGEHAWGATIGIDPSLYITIGTGIGGGFLVDGNPLHGLCHPEMGHIPLPHDLARDPFRGSCPYHGDCFEGLASGAAIEHRLGKKAEHVANDDPYWALETAYIAAALVPYVLTLSPRRIVLGGGIMQREFLLGRVRRQVLHALGGYVRSSALIDHIDDYIVAPALGNRSGIFGALALAARLPKQR